MFDEVKRELRRLEGSHLIPTPLAIDHEGYLDRKCPSEECQCGFKVHLEDWRDKVRDEEVFCPFCGHRATSGSWCTEDQSDYLKGTGATYFRSRIRSAMKRDADNLNRLQSRNSFITITMKVDSRPVQVPVPPQAADPMRLKISCPACACRYAAIGAAFFCPACGHNSAKLMLGLALNGIRSTLRALPEIRAAIVDPDTAATTLRQIRENSLINAVTAFQRYVESQYESFPGAIPARRNAFQNLEEGSALWHSVSGRRYEHYLTSDQLAVLTRYFQQRHLLTHTQGIVDDDYIERTGDTAYQVGQRLVIRSTTVSECLLLVDKLTGGMAADTPSSAG